MGFSFPSTIHIKLNLNNNNNGGGRKFKIALLSSPFYYYNPTIMNKIDTIQMILETAPLDQITPHTLYEVIMEVIESEEKANEIGLKEIRRITKQLDWSNDFIDYVEDQMPNIYNEACAWADKMEIQ